MLDLPAQRVETCRFSFLAQRLQQICLVNGTFINACQLSRVIGLRLRYRQASPISWLIVLTIRFHGDGIPSTQIRTHPRLSAGRLAIRG
jgi:hypothetical protein